MRQRCVRAATEFVSAVTVNPCRINYFPLGFPLALSVGAAQQQEVVAMKSFEAVAKNAEAPTSVVWGSKMKIGAVTLAALLVACSITVGCSNDKPKAASASSQIPLTPPQTMASSLPMPDSSKEVAKPAVKKVQRKRPATKMYADKTYGVSFEYPKKYEIETGDKAKDLLASGAVTAKQDGEVLAAVELPGTVFPNTDFAGAFFSVSVDKGLSAEQCGGSSEQKAAVTEPAPAVVPATDAPVDTKQEVSSTGTSEAQPVIEDQSKRILGDSELHATEMVTGEGARQSDAKYFRTFQNGACYEFTLNVTTVGNDDATMKHVDRDRVFDRLEKILATVKIAPLVAEPAPAVQTTASIPAAPTSETPAQK